MHSIIRAPAWTQPRARNHRRTRTRTPQAAHTPIRLHAAHMQNTHGLLLAAWGQVAAARPGHLQHRARLERGPVRGSASGAAAHAHSQAARALRGVQLRRATQAILEELVEGILRCWGSRLGRCNLEVMAFGALQASSKCPNGVRGTLSQRGLIVHAPVAVYLAQASVVFQGEVLPPIYLIYHSPWACHPSFAPRTVKRKAP